MQPMANVVSSASSMAGNVVRNLEGDTLGKIEELMIDLDDGRVTYAVLSFGGFLGMHEKLVAVPWDALTLDLDAHEFILNIDRDRLESAPGFNKESWPQMADRQWAQNIHEYYGHRPYWDARAPL